MGFFDKIKDIGAGFLSGGIGGAITAGMTYDEREEAKDAARIAERTRRAAQAQNLNDQTRAAIENILLDRQAMEEGFQKSGVQDSSLAEETRLRLQRDAQARLGALQSAREQFEAGTNLADLQAELDKATRRAEVVAQGAQTAGSLAMMGLSGMGGQTAGIPLGANATVLPTGAAQAQPTQGYVMPGYASPTKQAAPSNTAGLWSNFLFRQG